MTNPFGHPLPANAGHRPSGVTAILAGFAGLALAPFLGYLPVQEFIANGLDVPARPQILLGVYFFAAVVLLLGALVTFFRAVTGGVLLLAGAVVTIAAVLGEPLFVSDTGFTEFFRSVFTFTCEDAFVRVAATVGGPVVLVLSAMPATFRYLKHPAYPPDDRSQGW